MGGSVNKILKSSIDAVTLGVAAPLTKKIFGSGSSSSSSGSVASGSTVISDQSYAGKDRDDDDAVELGSSRSSATKGRKTGRRSLMAAQTSTKSSGASSTAGGSGLKV